MTTYALVLIIIGACTVSCKIMKFIDWLEGGKHV